MESTSGNPRDPEGGSDTPTDVDTTLFLSSDIEDSDGNEDRYFCIETEESENYSSDSDNDMGDRGKCCVIGARGVSSW